MTGRLARIQGLIAVVLVLWIAGCAGTQAPGEAGAERFVKTELYFGLSRPGGKVVSDAEWKQFLEENITPRFPQGLTVVDADGQWRNKAGKVIREKTKLVILVHPATRDSLAAVQGIIFEYKQKFQQEAVLRVTGTVGVSF